MNQVKDPETLIICKTRDTSVSRRNDGKLEETVHYFFEALSGYVSFLKDRSGFKDSDNASENINLFLPSSDAAKLEVPLTNAAPVVLFTESFVCLKKYVNVNTLVSRMGDYDIHIRTLRDLWNMAADSYKKYATDEILDQQILLSQALLILTPPSHIRLVNKAPVANSLLNEVAVDAASIELVLVGLLTQRFRQSSAEEDAQQITELYSDILASATLNNRPQIITEYANFLVLRFERDPQPEYRDKALLLYKSALLIIIDDETEILAQFNLLVDISQTILLGEVNDENREGKFRADIDEAIYYLRLAMKFKGCNSHGRFSMAKRLLSACLSARYRMTHDPADLNESAELMNDEDDPHTVAYELRNTIVFEIDNLQDSNKLKELIEILRRSLKVHSFLHPSRPKTLVSLGKALALLFYRGGAKKYLDEATLCLREAISLTPKSIVATASLLDVLSEKAEIENSGFASIDPYVEEIIALTRQYIRLLPQGVKSKNYLEQLLKPFTNRSASTHALLNIISDTQESEESDIYSISLRISGMYWLAFTTSKDAENLNESIFHMREAAKHCPDSHHHRAGLFHDLGDRLLQRYDLLNDVKDLEESFDWCRKSIHILTPQSYYKSLYCGELGIAMTRKIRRLIHDGDKYNLAAVFFEMIGLFKAGVLEASGSPVPARFRSAKVWALISDTFNDSASALEAYQQAINMLPRLSSMASNTTLKHETIRAYRTDGLSRKAALFAIRIGKYEKAVEFLEAGRAVFWLQALQLRSPMEKLRNRFPDLHLKFSNISSELEAASLHMTTSHTPVSNEEQHARDKEIFRLEELHEEWQRTFDDIHKLDDFDDFLLPQSLTKLQASIDCPVIFLIPDKHQSHGLIMFANDVRHVNLMNAGYENLQSLASKVPGAGSCVSSYQFQGQNDDLSSALGFVATTKSNENNTHERKGGPKHFNQVDTEDEMKYVLEVLWKDVVGPLVQELSPHTRNGSLLKVCWCPTGIFSFLLLHAAGIYRKDMSSVESAFDHIISTYIPTVGVLSRRATTSTKDEFKMMVIIDPNLPNASKEMAVIERHIHKDCLIRMGTKDSPAFVEKVASNLSGVSIVHFVCHGRKNDQPLDSSLILHDGNLKISRIMEEHMSNAAVAFLCACETAMGDQSLPDEAMHLGATLLYSGFRGVVATMWDIDDEDGPVVADRFYAHLFKEDSKRPNTSLSAEAYHYAMTTLREKGVAFKRWVPFIHLGS